MKTCFKCGRSLPIEEFYRHSAMADGHLGKCKGCTCLDVHIWYRRTSAARVEYERQRNRTSKRRAAALEYVRRRRRLRPDVVRACNLTGRALKSGLLQKRPCEVCGSLSVQAHHPDYSRPLYVRWLCRPHHREVERLAAGREAA